MWDMCDEVMRAIINGTKKRMTLRSSFERYGRDSNDKVVEPIP